MRAPIAASTALGTPVQGADDIVAHLCFVSAERLHVALRVGERAITGVLGCPDPEQGIVPFCPRDPGTLESLGVDGAASLRVVYGDTDANYGFRAERWGVVGDGRVWIQLPTAIRCTSRRLSSRCLAGAGWSLKAAGVGILGGERHLDLFDLSVSGVGAVFEPSRCVLREGTLFSGVLSIPDRLRLPVRAEVRHIRRKVGSSWLRIAGCRFRDLGHLNHALLSGELALNRDRKVANL